VPLAELAEDRARLPVVVVVEEPVLHEDREILIRRLGREDPGGLVGVELGLLHDSRVGHAGAAVAPWAVLAVALVRLLE
jgi:hypothetical protein